ncbi:dTDP-4-dehydrorhamnose reductase [Fodinibius sp.]|uniref:dTDP-4-dehydrorhamnose reductase n=1 Tax=Fodinibius sp. TaxID=1872440 RepID=UPI0035649CA6
MKIMLLGAGGQLGREWQIFFKKREHNHILLPYTSAQLDITHASELTDEVRQQQPGVVINCAAYTDVDGAEEQRDLARKVNTDAVGQLGKLSAEMGFILVHYSTDYVFPGEEEDREQFPDGYAEDHPADPVNYYGQTKWEGEQAIRKTTGHHLILRISWLCGAFGSNFVKTMLRLGCQREVLQVVDDQWGSPSFTAEVVRHTWTLLKAEETGTFHSTSRGLITWYDLAEAIFVEKDIDIDVTVKAVPSEAFPTVAERPRFSKLNTQKIESVPGCTVEEWEVGLARLLYQLRK